MTDEADRLRAQKGFSTDPDRLEREAQLAEARSGTKKLCDMPGDGPWEMRVTTWGILGVSETHGVWRLDLTADGDELKGTWTRVVV